MNRLPSCDRTTQRSEMAVYASLGLAAVVMISLALVQTTKYVAGSDQIAAALSPQSAALATTTPAGGGKTILTNAAKPPGARATAPAVSPDKV